MTPMFLRIGEAMKKLNINFFNRMNVVHLIIITLLFLTPVMVKAIAQDLSFEVTVNNNHVAVNDEVQMNLTIYGAKGSVDPISLPAIDGFDVHYLGPSTSISISGSQYLSQRSFIYQLIPQKQGQFTIPSLEIKVEGQTLRSKELSITVGEARPEPPSPEEEMQKNGDVRFELSIPKNEAYLREPIVLSMKFYMKENIYRNIQPPRINQNGFDVGYLNYEDKQEVQNGVNYHVIQFYVPIYPKKVGEIEIGPAQVNAEMIVPVSDGSVLSQLLGSITSRPITLTSNVIKLKVKDLPTENQPEDFTYGVGQYDFNVQASPLDVKIGDPITVTMTLQGSGVMKGLHLPTIKQDGFKSYDPKDSADEKGLKRELVIIPNRADLNQIDAIHFTYFDTKTESYQTITRGPFPLKVHRDEHAEEFKAVGFNNLKPENSEKNEVEGVVTWVQQLKRQIRTLGAWFSKTLVWGSCIFLLIAGLLLRWWQVYQNRLKTDEAFSRRENALRLSRKNLDLAKTYHQQDNPKGFYEALEKALIGLVTDSMNLPMGRLHPQDLPALFQDKGEPPSSWEQFMRVWSEAEAVRFGGQVSSGQQREQHYQLIMAWVTYIAKSLENRNDFFKKKD